MTTSTDTEQANSYQQNNVYGAVPKVQEEQNDDIHVVERHTPAVTRNPYVKAGVVSAILAVAVLAFRASSNKGLPADPMTELQSLVELDGEIELLGKKKKQLKDWQTPLYYTDQLVDHFAEDTGTWPNRYYVGEEHWKGPGYPLIVIIGGEGAVDEALYPYVVDVLAPKFGAYVLQTEHRFYGTSYPTEAGPSALPTSDEYRRLFRPDQALEDFVRLTRHIQGKIGCSIDRTDPNYCPVITVGASYPGFLSAMMRFVHPEVVDMSYASSAPLKLYDQSMDQYVYFDHITMVADRDSPGCKEGQRSTLEEVKPQLENMSIKKAAKALGICADKIPAYITTPEILAHEIVMMVGFSWADFNMDYHPPKDPTTAVMRTCKAFKKHHKTPLERLAEYFIVRKELMAFQPDAECYDLHWDIPLGKNARITGADWSGMGEGIEAMAWEFQCCRDLIIKTGFGPDSMFYPAPFDLDFLDKHCQARFGVDPEPYRMRDEWHFDDLIGNGGSHILFVNGLNDGWSPLSYTEDLSDTILALNIPSGAHHSELNHVREWESCGKKPGQECDDVIEVQKEIPVILEKWIDEVKQLSKQ